VSHANTPTTHAEPPSPPSPPPPDLGLALLDGFSSVADTIANAVDASADLALIPSRARLLRTIASRMESRREALLALASSETALTIDELVPELARTLGTLRLFADWIESPAFSTPLHSPAIPPGDLAAHPPIGPNHDLSRVLVPLGKAIAVFGASNFPFAYGVIGTDASSALAAGCSVVVKEHPAHPRTGRAIASIVRAAAADAHVNPACLGYIPHTDAADLTVAAALVAHPNIAGVGFTGSLGAGQAVASLAQGRPRPIPAYCEMGSANPVFITRGAVQQRAPEIAWALAPSILARVGQQCTRPGILITLGTSADAEPLHAALADAFNSASERDMLAPWIASAFVRRIIACAACAGVRMLAGSGEQALPPGSRRVGACLLEASPEAMRAHATLREEIFGPALIASATPSIAELPDLQPSLTTTIWTASNTPTSDPDFAPLLAYAIQRSGRIIINGVPTGVRVAPAMHHGGPFPATNQPHATAVGPHAIARWQRPVTLQGWPTIAE
jgi:NADP-dependent aldehyde dehydrogenase